MNKLFVTAILLIVPVLTFAQVKTVTFNQDLLIKEDKDNYLIGQLAGISVDSGSNMYLFDSVQNSVIKLNK